MQASYKITSIDALKNQINLELHVGTDQLNQAIVVKDLTDSYAIKDDILHVLAKFKADLDSAAEQVPVADDIQALVDQSVNVSDDELPELSPEDDLPPVIADPQDDEDLADPED